MLGTNVKLIFFFPTALQEEEDVRARRLGPLRLAAAQLQWFWQELVPAALSELGLSSLYGAESVSAVVRWAPAALRQHRRGAPEWTLALSPAGDVLAIVQNLQVSFRYAADNFRITKMTWKSAFSPTRVGARSR